MNGLLSQAKSKNVADKIFRTKGSRLHREEKNDRDRLHQSEQSSMRGHRTRAFQTGSAVRGGRFDAESVHIRTNQERRLQANSGRHLTEFLMERTSPRPHPPAGAKHRGVGAATAVKHPDSRKARIPNGNNPEESNPPRQNPQQNPTAIVRNRSKSATQSKAASRNIARPAA